MKSRRMIEMNRVAKLVQEDKVAQIFGQSHQKETQRKVPSGRTTAPLGTRSPNRNSAITEAKSCCQLRHTHRQLDLGLPTQYLDLLGGIRLGRIGRLSRLHPFPSRLNPDHTLLQKGERPRLTHPRRETQAHLARGLDREGQPAGPRIANQSNRPENRVCVVGGQGPAIRFAVEPPRRASPRRQPRH